ncbi:uncharacterized protein LOC135218555 [Macrobrachium nipponense]|uniref:uncharacterized protein LOC135218555 n=1 Tax=Macrobrachium nipponense TaxID=159736 RepID=UPI0030C7AC1D
MELVQKKKNSGKSASMKELHGKVAREVALLSEEYKHLEKKETFLRSEVLLHLTELSHKGDLSSVVITNHKLMLQRDHLDILQKNLECIRKSSGIEVTQVEDNLDIVESPEEDVAEDIKLINESRSAKRKKDEEKGLIKSMQVKGEIGQFKMETKLVTQYLVNYHSKQREIPYVNVNPLPDCVQLMYQAFQPIEPSHLSHFMNSLYYFEMLTEEREETALMLEENLQVKTIKTSEPWILEFSPAVDQDIIVEWGFTFKKKNLCLQNSISINCTDEVIAFYSQSEEVFLYLSAGKELKTSIDIIRFFKSFS